MSWWKRGDEPGRMLTRQEKEGRAPRPADELAHESGEGARDTGRDTGWRGHAARWLQRAYGNQYVQEFVARARGQGKPLEPGTRREMEAMLGQDFGEVRVHTGPDAQAAVVELDAAAFTDGTDIFFAPDQYQPAAPQGRARLAHELGHVVQQRGGSPGTDGVERVTDPEQGARHAERAARGETVRPFALAPSNDTAPARDPADWGDDVRAAQQIQDEARRAQAMLALVQRALGAQTRVQLAGNTHPAQVHPDDCQPLPVVNFDIRLNDKSSYSSQGRGYSLRRNYGYSFRTGGSTYSVIGPNALDPRSPLFTRMSVEHELYLGTAWLNRTGRADPNRSNQELDLWVHDFRNYFHQLYSFGQQWLPLVQYYESADATPRQAALQQLLDYYNHPPVPANEQARIRDAFARWLRRRLGDAATASLRLIQDLEAQLHLGSAGGGSPTP